MFALCGLCKEASLQSPPYEKRLLLIIEQEHDYRTLNSTSVQEMRKS